MAVWPSSETVFDLATKETLRSELTAKMGEPGFWDNPEKAQETIQKIKPLTGLLKPYEELLANVGDLACAQRNWRGEDASLDAELEAELARMEKSFADFEMQSMLSGSQDASNAYLRIQAGTGGTEACDWARNAAPHAYGRWAERHGYQADIVDELRNDDDSIPQAPRRRIKGDFAYGRSRAKQACIGWSGSARSIPTPGARRRLQPWMSCPKSRGRSKSRSNPTS